MIMDDREELVQLSVHIVDLRRQLEEAECELDRLIMERIPEGGSLTARMQLAMARNPGARVPSLARALGCDLKQAHNAVRNLMAQRLVRKTGRGEYVLA